MSRVLVALVVSFATIAAIAILIPVLFVAGPLFAFVALWFAALWTVWSLDARSDR